MSINRCRKIILSDPRRYGYALEENDLYNPLQVERVQIELTQPLPIMEIAKAIGSYYKEIKEMNLHLFEETIPPGIHFLNLPPGTAEKFWAFFNSWKKEREGEKEEKWEKGRKMGQGEEMGWE
jgi:hypothetical protein